MVVGGSQEEMRRAAVCKLSFKVALPRERESNFPFQSSDLHGSQ